MSSVKTVLGLAIILIAQDTVAISPRMSLPPTNRVNQIRQALSSNQPEAALEILRSIGERRFSALTGKRENIFSPHH